MATDYFVTGSKEYFKAEDREDKKEEKQDIKDFNISTRKYTKTNVRVVIEEYAIKD